MRSVASTPGEPESLSRRDSNSASRSTSSLTVSVRETRIWASPTSATTVLGDAMRPSECASLLEQGDGDRADQTYAAAFPSLLSIRKCIMPSVLKAFKIVMNTALMRVFPMSPPNDNPAVTFLSELWGRSGVRNGDMVLLHSSVRATLRRLKKLGFTMDVETILDSFLHVLGEEGTLRLP